MLSSISMAKLSIRLASCAYSVAVPQLVNYGIQLFNSGQNAALYIGITPGVYTLHSCTTNEKFLAFSPSDFSVSILTSSPLLSCHSESATADI